MVDLTKYLNSDLIIPGLKADTREGVIKELVEKIYSQEKASEYGVSFEKAYEAVMKRELLQTTGIGNGIAVPHARIEGWKNLSLAIGIKREGVDFKSPDKIRARYIFLMISSPDEPYVILQTMSAIVRFMTDLGVAEPGADKYDEVLKKLLEGDMKASEHILASDVARPVMDCVNTETSLEEVARIMHLKKQDVLPVVDSENVLKGEISCCDIFEFGMPDFFRQLNTVSFVRYIDPFEKYFRIKKNLKVKDVFTTNHSGFKSDSTLLEIIFEMTVRNKSRIFVVDDDGRLTGIIDRFCIIDKILFF